jgi:hypothetical protein
MIKNETKMLLDELEKQIDDVRAKGGDDDMPMPEETEPETAEAKQKDNDSDSNSTSPAPQQRARRQSQRNASPPEKEPKKRGFSSKNIRGQKVQKRNVVSSSEDSSDSSDSD